MDNNELITRLKRMPKEGFDDAFAEFCAKTFASFEYPPENLAAAKMHAYYLRQAIALIVDGDDTHLDGNSPREALCREVARKAYTKALKGEASFERLFVLLWCQALAERP